MMSKRVEVAQFLLSPQVTLIRKRCLALLAHHFLAAWATNVQLHWRRFTEPWLSNKDCARYVQDGRLTSQQAAMLRELGGVIFVLFALLVINCPRTVNSKPVFLDLHCNTDNAGSLLCLVLLRLRHTH